MNIKKKVSNILWGLFLIALAVVLVLYKLELINFSLFAGITVWQFVLGAVFLYLLFHCIFTYKSATGCFFSIAIIAIVFSPQLNIEKLVPWTILIVAALLSLGVHLIWGKNNSVYPRHHYHSNGNTARDRNGNPVIVETVEGDVINENVSFTGATKYIHSDNFSRADLNCSFCGAEFFFDNVIIPSKHAEIVITSSFCGVSLFVPKNWTVINEMNSFLGGVEIDNQNIEEPIATIVLKGSNSFSGVEVKRV